MGGGNKDDVRPKKSVRPSTRANNGAIFMLRCAELGFTRAEDLDQMSVGMIYDLIVEKANDQEQYPFKGTQADIKQFFG